MEYIHRLPFVLACLAAMSAGVSGYITGAENRIIYMRMTIMMLAFFIIGLYIKNTIVSLEDEVRIKKLEKEEQERVEKQKEEEAAELEQASMFQGQDQGQPQKQPQKQQQKQQQKVDLIAQDEDDDFEPLAISKAIKSKIAE